MRVLHRSIATTLVLSTCAIAFSAPSGATSAENLKISTVIAAGDAQRYVVADESSSGDGQVQTIQGLAGPGFGSQYLSGYVGDGPIIHMTVEYLNRTLYVKAALGFLQGTFGLKEKVAKSYVNKWVIVSPENPAYKNVSSAVTMSSLMADLTFSGKVTDGVATVKDGVKVRTLNVVVTKSGSFPAGKGSIYVAANDLPVVSSFKGGGFTSTSVFKDWGKKFTLTAPQKPLRLPN